MSEYVKAANTYDLTKNITGIEVNTGFILGLDAILMYYIANIVKDPSTLSTTFKKFETILTGKPNSKDFPELDQIERQLYTLFALQQLFKAKAKEQGLEIEMESKVTKEDLSDYMKNIMDNDDEAAASKLQKIQELIKKKDLS